MTQTRSRTKTARREKKVVYEFEDGEIIDADKIPSTPQAKPGLFMKDLEEFYAEIQQGKTSEVNKGTCIRSLEIAEEIHSFF
uniref:Uncharacterized protein n=1 Tax=Arion vulgaris TaxID=1028688 RepID=A0A0B7AMZ5_9EUPU